MPAAAGPALKGLIWAQAVTGLAIRLAGLRLFMLLVGQAVFMTTAARRARPARTALELEAKGEADLTARLPLEARAAQVVQV